MDFILFSYKKKKLGSWLIRKASGEVYSHCVILYGTTVYESTGKGVIASDFRTWEKENTITNFKAIPQDGYLGEHRARALLGQCYDYPAIVWFGLVLLVQRLTGYKLPRLAINPRWLISSEFVWKVLFSENKSVTPREVYDKLS